MGFECKTLRTVVRKSVVIDQIGDKVSPQGPELVERFVPRVRSEGAVEAAHSFLRNSELLLDPGEEHSYGDGEIWSAQQTRHVGRKAHGWFFLRYLNAAHSQLTEEERTSVISKVNQLLEVWRDVSNEPSSMAFHDETTAQRAINFAVYLHTFSSSMSAEDQSAVLALLNDDADRLQDPSFYAGLNNHGMFQNIALLVLFNFWELPLEVEDLAIRRLRDYFDHSFTADGIHIENNPSYHLMVSTYLRKFSEYVDERGLEAVGDHLHCLLGKADLYAAHALNPAGFFPPISDTSHHSVTAQRARSIFDTGYLEYAASNGRQGKQPPTLDFVAERSGYAVCRSDWSQDGTQLFFSAAYNDDYHKHSDELSVYLYAKGREILREAGPNGYQYSDPLTKYAFSSAAHNTLLVDGEGLPRIDGKQSLTRLEDKREALGTFEVQGVTERFPGVKWDRTISCPIDFSGPLFIKDKVLSDKEHKYTFIWHFGQDVVPQVRGNFIELFDRSSAEKLAEMYVSGSPSSSVEVFNGLRHPRVQGYQFPRMGVPKTSYAVEVSYQTDALEELQLTWEVRLSDFKLIDRGVRPIDSDWIVFEGEKPVRYLLDNLGSIDQGLAIVFSAINPQNDFTYNYRSTLSNLPLASMYILDDFGDQGSYYLANGRNFAEFRSVQGAIHEVISEFNLSPSQIITIGSSKGGSAAIAHGVTLGAADIYAGAPQYKIGKFTASAHPNVLEYIAGGRTEADINWLDGVLSQYLKSGGGRSRIHVIVGEGDYHFTDHVVPLVDDAASLGYEVRMLNVPGIPHNELGAGFRHYLMSLNQYLGKADDQFAVPYASGMDHQSKTYGIAVDVSSDSLVLAQLFVDGVKTGPLKKLENRKARWQIANGKSARARIYVELPKGSERKAFGTRAHRSGDA